MSEGWRAPDSRRRLLPRPWGFRVCALDQILRHYAEPPPELLCWDPPFRPADNLVRKPSELVYLRKDHRRRPAHGRTCMPNLNLC